MSLTRSFERWDADHLWALYTVMAQPNAVSWKDDIFAEVLLELHRRGALRLAERGKSDDRKW